MQQVLPGGAPANHVVHSGNDVGAGISLQDEWRRSAVSEISWGHVLATQREHSRPVEVKQREEYMRKITIILSLLFFAVAFGVANAQSPRGYYCLSGFKFCPTVMQCVPLNYPCPNRARRR